MSFSNTRRRMIAVVSLGLVASNSPAHAEGASKPGYRVDPGNKPLPPLPPGIPANPADTVVKDFGPWHVVSIYNVSTTTILTERLKVFHGGAPGRIISNTFGSVSDGIPIKGADRKVVTPPPSTVDTQRRLLIGGQGELKLEYWSNNRAYSGKFRISTTSNDQPTLPVAIMVDGKLLKSLDVKQVADVDATELFGPNLSNLGSAKTLKATAIVDGAVYTIYEVEFSDTDAMLKQMRLIPDYNYNVRGLGNQSNAPSDSSGKCFLTSACCDVMGLADDCFELEALRRFRDTGMLTDETGRRDVAVYYELAPRILSEMHRRGELGRLRAVYFSTILPCAIMAKLGFVRPTRLLYSRMMKRLTARYI